MGDDGWLECISNAMRLLAGQSLYERIDLAKPKPGRHTPNVAGFQKNHHFQNHFARSWNLA